MSVRKKDQVRKYVESEYGDNVLYKHLYHSCKQYETELEHLRLCPEELFLLVLHIVDDIKENEIDYRENVTNIWDELYNDFLEYETDADKEEISSAVILVLTIVVVVLRESEYAIHYDTFAADITFVMQYKCDNVSLRIMRFYDNVGNTSSCVNDWIRSYWDSDDFFSYDIEDGMSGKMKQGAENAGSKPSSRQKGAKLTDETFRYVGYEVGLNRLQAFLNCLKKAKWIASDTDDKKFISIFTGGSSTERVKWLKSRGVLFTLMSNLMDKGLITCNEGKHWSIVESHFMDKKGVLLTEMHRQKKWIRNPNVFKRLADVLDPNVPLS